VISDRSKILADIFNLDAKLDNFPYGHYFSSKFLVYSNENWLLVPDPLKALFRLGRKDIHCKQHAEEYFTSFSDNNKLYKCWNVRQKLLEAVKIKHGKYFTNTDIQIRPLIDFVAELAENKDKFVNMFYSHDPKTWNRKLPPYLRKEFRKKEMVIDEFVEEFDEQFM
jgi:hypothetical protein